MSQFKRQLGDLQDENLLPPEINKKMATKEVSLLREVNLILPRSSL